MTRERVECDHCGKKITLRTDDIIPDHGWTHRGVFHHCEDSGKRYARHMASFFCANRPGRPFVAQCRCGAVWIDPDYKVAEKQWADHIVAEGAA